MRKIIRWLKLVAQNRCTKHKIPKKFIGNQAGGFTVCTKCEPIWK